MHNQRDVHCICRMNGLAKVDAMRTAIFEIALWWYCYSLWWFHAEPLAAATELVEVSAGAHWVVKLEAEVSMTDGRPPPRLLLQTVVVMTAVTWWRRTAGCSASLQCFILSTCRRLTFDLNHRLLACYWRRPPDRLTTRHPAAKLRSRRREHSEQPTSRMMSVASLTETRRSMLHGPTACSGRHCWPTIFPQYFGIFTKTQFWTTAEIFLTCQRSMCRFYLECFNAVCWASGL